MNSQLPTGGGRIQGGHSKVKHRADQYVNYKGLHTNTAKSYFALFKRGIHGTFRRGSKKHLSRYCDEFSFGWNGRKVENSQRRKLAVQQVEGKGRRYKLPISDAC